MIKINREDFDKAVSNLSGVLKGRFSMPLKKAKAQDVFSQVLGYKNFNTYLGLNKPVAELSFYEEAVISEVVAVEDQDSTNYYWVSSYIIDENFHNDDPAVSLESMEWNGPEDILITVGELR